MNKNIKIKINDSISLANDLSVSVIAGPCVIESREHTLEIAKKIKDVCLQKYRTLRITYFFS